MWSRSDKIYLAVLVTIGLAFLASALVQPAQVRELNARLSDDIQLAVYPYKFRVLQVKDAVAVMSSPRSADVPVLSFIGAIDPALADVNADNLRFQAAQQTLVALQTRARDIVLDAPGIEAVSWELDEQWLSRHGVERMPR